MKILRKLIYTEVINAVAFVTLGFLALFFFFDLVAEIQSVGTFSAAGYTLVHGLSYVALTLPNHLYELMPITVLIGTIFVMARLAQSSEFTILRTSGLGPGRALQTLLLLGFGFVLLTFVLGDYISPLADRTGRLLKAHYTGHITVGQTGAWLKEKQTHSHCMVNVGEMASDGSLRDIQIFEFENQGGLISTLFVKSARVTEDNAWLLEHVARTQFPPAPSQAGQVVRHQLDTLRWPNRLSAEMVSTALLRPDRMRTIDLFEYIDHLKNNGQTAQRYEIAFWKKVFYPLSCLVMVVLALPFAYLHFRSGNITTYVFAGIMAGIGFFLLNNVMGYVGNLQNWAPWLTAALPGLLYSLLSLTAFGWLVWRR